MTTIFLTLATLAAALLDGSMLELQRGGDAWRIVTCHFTHWTYEQLAWDALAFLGLGIACQRRHRDAYHATLLASIVIIPIAVLFFDPRIAAYRGLSGLDSALFALLVVSTRNVLLGVLFAGKIAFEAFTGGAVFASGGGFEVVTVAHVAGALIGAAFGLRSSHSLKRPDLCLLRRTRGVTPLFRFLGRRAAHVDPGVVLGVVRCGGIVLLRPHLSCDRAPRRARALLSRAGRFIRAHVLHRDP